MTKVASSIFVRARAYYRVTKPGIIRANVLTAIAGYLFGAKSTVVVPELASLALGTVLVIASGCVLNNIKDRSIDAKMQRTQKREIVTGIIGVQNAYRYAIVLGIVGLVVLVVYTNILTASIGVFALITYVWVYGYAKRYTHYGTEVGTLPGAASLVAGYTAATQQLDEIALSLAIVMIFWQMAHFLAITLFRSSEYKAAGITVLPHRKGQAKTQRRIMFMILLFVASIVLLAMTANTSLVFLFVMLLIGGYWLYSGLQHYGVTKPDKWARTQFGLSLIVLLSFCVLLSLDQFLP